MRCTTIALILLITPAALPVGSWAQGLQLMPGARLVIQGAPVLVLNNTGLTNSGQIAPGNSTVFFTADTPASASFIGGPVPVSFYNITITRSTGDVQFNNDATVAGAVTLIRGNLQLHTHLLDLGQTGTIIGENNNARITGTDGGLIRKTVLLTAPYAVNPGNIGLEITSDAYLGWTTITRGNVQQTETGIQRYFEIAPERNTGLNASLRFFYLDEELAGRDKRALAFFAGGGESTAWTPLGKENDGEAVNPGQEENAGVTGSWVVKRNIGELHRVTLATSAGSAERSVTRPATRELIRIAPNPCSGTFRMILTGTKEGDKMVRLYDALGHLLQERKIHCLAGVNIFDWNIAGFGQGEYLLATEGGESVPVEILR